MTPLQNVTLCSMNHDNRRDEILRPVAKVIYFIAQFINSTDTV